MRVAAIDIGSNTVHLLIADTDGAMLRPVADPSRALFLGQDVARSGSLQPVRLARAVETVIDFAKRAADAGAERTIAMATEAIRRAENGDALIERCRDAGITIDLISARREGELAFIGASIDSPTRGPAMLADIGGASTQLVAIADGLPVAIQSIPLGSGTLAAGLAGDPPGAVAIARLGARIGPAIDGALAKIPYTADVNRLIGVGGTIRRIGRLAGNALLPSEPSRTAIGEIVEALYQAPANVIGKRLTLDAQRVPTLRVGGLVLVALLERLSGARLRVSTAGIREGAALLLARGLNPSSEGIFPR